MATAFHGGGKPSKEAKGDAWQRLGEKARRETADQLKARNPVGTPAPGLALSSACRV